MSADSAHVNLDCILMGAACPQPEMPSAPCAWCWVEHSLGVRLHSGPACSGVVHTVEAAGRDSEQSRQSGRTPDPRSFALLESGWVVFNRVKTKLTA